ncbi:(2Fe-2S)-binding protein [Novosphingobium marinum]|uniref:Phenylpropionate dioxygenase-like ring-hydroxylating dioxygenase large terminal subunit n=1 Tax=Novosphingobium marinum TaxID=1514948 RepID=A0A7Y9XSQ5_9SPHN|nr:aromatic ring-hydroxylating dioxygenase subunit alpha [Novosphingobium marinum]NYH93777.1 phenylpropionate dioxygenase-like ring-hydroxylating dioxygenase large terminal subunit [Novosphingobium marinum]GGC17211.1 (2Fe-2S)-binding protein [Novosphingobium marinum]
MGKIEREIRPGEARSPAMTYQHLLERDGERPPGTLADESYRFLGDEDIPFARYTDRAFYDLEMERMWTRTWQWVCREEHIADVGDYYVYDIGKHSIVVVRTKEGIKGYPNSCLHRGTKLKPSHSEGWCEQLRCPFHGWTWTLEGELAQVPSRWDLPHVVDEAFRLPEVRIATWGGFVFMNMDPKAPDLLDYLDVLPDHAERSRLEDREVALHLQKELDCNWKVASEAFLEAYHVRETHPQLLIANGGEVGQYDVYGPHLNRVISPNGITSPDLPRSVTEQERAEAMLSGNSGPGEPVHVPEGMTARQVMADIYRKGLSAEDAAATTAGELLDTNGYLVFPASHFFLGLVLPIAYRIRPLDDRVDRALFEVIVLRKVKPGEAKAPPPEPVRLKVEDSYAEVPGMSPSFAQVMDQDTSIMAWQQEGFSASRKGEATLSNYQEVRIRHAHMTLDRYLAAQPGEPVDFSGL